MTKTIIDISPVIRLLQNLIHLEIEQTEYEIRFDCDDFPLNGHVKIQSNQANWLRDHQHYKDSLLKRCPLCGIRSVQIHFYENEVYDCKYLHTIDPTIISICHDCLDLISQPDIFILYHGTDEKENLLHLKRRFGIIDEDSVEGIRARIVERFLKLTGGDS